MSERNHEVVSGQWSSCASARGVSEENAPPTPTAEDLWLPNPFLNRPLTTDHRPLLVAGIDEAGRGPLAGPVAAAAVILPTGFDPEGVTDSKKMTAAARETAFARIIAEASVGVALVHAEEIDRINILRATHEAMRRALAALSEVMGASPDVVFVDGLPVPNLHPDCRNLIKGDSRCLSIAAASIIAKVTRDRLLCDEYDAQYPHYGFARHKGYPSPEHLAALAEHGPCPLHRRTFGPVAQLCLKWDK